MLKMKSGCQVSWDAVPAAVGFTSPEREEQLARSPLELGNGLAAFAGSTGSGLRRFIP